MTLTYDPSTPSPLLLWGTSWDADSGTGDWVIDGTSLEDDSQLFTAIMLCVFTDRRAREDDDLPGDGDDRRGWWGDFVDVRDDNGETELGSLLWLYERAALTDATVAGMKDAVEDCLVPLTEQGMVARFDVIVEANKITGHVEIQIKAYSQANQLRFDQKFLRVWQQIYPQL